jgi:subtilase family serine protease
VARPDLVVTSVEPNAPTVNQGAALSVTRTVKNQGSVAAAGSSVAFRLSVNYVFGDSDDVVISTASSTPGLAPGATNTVTLNVTVPATTPPNIYHVCAMADRLNAVVEANETNNTLCSQGTVEVRPPDLLMTAVSTTATAVAPGKTFTLSNTVKNQGGSKAGAFTIAFHLSSDATYGGSDDVAMTATRSLTALAIGASSTASTTLTVPATTPLGTYYVCAMADSGNTVAEGDENNNSRCTATPIQVTRPNLVMTAVTPNATTVTRGTTLSVGNTVQNQGLIASTAFRIAFRLSPNNIYGDSDDVVITTIRSVTSLAAGASSTGTTSFTVPTSTAVGTYYVCTMADSLNGVIETNEGDNTLCSGGTVTVQ